MLLSLSGGSRQDAWFDPRVQDASLSCTCLPSSKAIAAATSLSAPGSRALVVHSLWILARVPLSLPVTLPDVRQLFTAE